MEPANNNNGRREITRVLVCAGRDANCAQSPALLVALQTEIARSGLAEAVTVSATPCRGLCAQGPVVIFEPQGLLYCRVQPADAGEIVAETLQHGQIIRRLLYQPPADLANVPFYADLPLFSKQVRVALANCGIIDPESIEDYIAQDGYRALGKVLTEMSPEDVIRQMKESGLRGRGGAGFLTGAKWEFCRKSPGNVKYVICNADEGDPGAFMDRSILESDPHSAIEGMTIAAYAIGAHEGFIYCREEYPLAIGRLQNAINQAREHGLLGERILGGEFSFDIQMKEGAGAFVCGEESALIASIEGGRGEPRPRPPFPAVKGLWNKPSNINNVKSYAITPRILLKGPKWFASIGSPKSPGTAVFALTGQVNNTGLIEVPMGIPLGDIIFDVGGGLIKGKQFKAVQTGGPLGGCLPASSLNTPVDFDSLQAAGAVMGSGGMIVVDDDTCMVEFAKYFLTFAAAESCGKCVPCRVGGQRLLEALTRITDGEGSEKDLKIIEEVSQHMMSASLCGLGQRTPGPVMAALRFFGQEFHQHIHEKLCYAGQCRKLVRAKCVNACPAGVDTPAYVALVSQGRIAEGLAIHRERNPFASVCGRVCPAFCEKKCRRGEIDDPLAIRLIKRYMADHELEKPWLPEAMTDEVQRKINADKRIAVVGAGPAGLTAALRLSQYGYKVTVLEKQPVPGGMMSLAIPAYRLPREPLFAEIENIRRAGVDIRCNAALGQDFSLDDLFDRDGYSAVVLAIGAWRSRRLSIPGEELAGVINGLDFLRDVAAESSLNALGKSCNVKLPDMQGKRVAIIGGGDVAIDVARTAVRMGAKEVHVVYRRAGEDMPANHLPEEIQGALNEGVRLHVMSSPIEVLGENGQVTGIKLQRQRLAEFDASARRKPVAEPGEVYTLNVDWVMPAISQSPDLTWNQRNPVEHTAADTLVIDEAYGTTRPGVFAAGDVITGPATIVQAVAQGNLVSVAVDHWLRTGERLRPRYVTPRHDVPSTVNLEEYAQARRPGTPRLPLNLREGTFREVELGFDQETASREAARCLRCDLEWLQLMGLSVPSAPEKAEMSAQTAVVHGEEDLR